MAALKGGAIERFLKAPGPGTVFILVYGPDAGLVKERGRRLITALGIDRDDPFALSRLDETDISDDPTRLADEAHAIALTAPRRVVWITGAGAATAQALDSILADPPEAAVIVAEAGTLAPAAKLRKLAETSKHAVALACYVDETRSLSALIDEEVGRCGLAIADDARTLLISLLGADRALSRREIEKLCSYAMGKTRIERGDVELICGDVTAEAVSGAVDAALEGNFGAFDRSFTKAIAEGVGPIRLLSVAGQQLWQLIKVDAGCRAGGGIDRAIGGLRPPPHFSRRDRIKAQLPRWSGDTLRRAEKLVHEADAACRSTGAPREALARNALMMLARAARVSPAGGSRR